MVAYNVQMVMVRVPMESSVLVALLVRLFVSDLSLVGTLGEANSQRS